MIKKKWCLNLKPFVDLDNVPNLLGPSIIDSKNTIVLEQSLDSEAEFIEVSLKPNSYLIEKIGFLGDENPLSGEFFACNLTLTIY